MAGKHHKFSVAQVAASVRLDMGTYIAVGITLFCGFLLSQHPVRYRFANSLIANRQVLMRYKILGERTGLKVSELALGTGMFG